MDTHQQHPVVAPQTDDALQPDEAEDGLDSAIADDQTTLTQSLRSSLLDSVKENGRSYHRYKSISGSDLGYFVPEDEAERDRLDLQHEIWLYTFDGKLLNAPINPKEIKNVLDLGTGTGIWATDFADEYPHTTVLGTDLSPIQPQYIPPNCKFEIDDFASEWTFNQKFDYIHARGLCGASSDFPGTIRQAYNALNPAGWLEMPDAIMPIADVDGSMKGSKLEEWSDRQVDACAKTGIDTRACSKYKQWMIEQGFEEVIEIPYKWPLGSWPKDSKHKYLGKLSCVNLLAGLEGFSLRLWTGVLGIPYEQVLLDLSEVRKDIANPKIHAYWQMYTVCGRKPR